MFQLFSSLLYIRRNWTNKKNAIVFWFSAWLFFIIIVRKPIVLFVNYCKIVIVYFYHVRKFLYRKCNGRKWHTFYINSLFKLWLTYYMFCGIIPSLPICQVYKCSQNWEWAWSGERQGGSCSENFFWKSIHNFILYMVGQPHFCPTFFYFFFLSLFSHFLWEILQHFSHIFL